MRDTVRIIIPTRDPKNCGRIVHDLLEDGWHEIVVVHPRSAVSIPGVTSIQTAGLLSPAAARNRAATGATTSLLCFIDDDAICTSATLDTLVHACIQDTVVAVGPLLGDGPRDPYWRRCMHRIMAGPQFETAPSTPTERLMSMCMVVRTTVFEEMRGFDETFSPAGEDTELSMRLATRGRLIIDGNARIMHRPDPDSWWIATRRLYRYGVAWAQITAERPRPSSWVRRLPTVLRWCLVCLIPYMAIIDAIRATSIAYWAGYAWLRVAWYIGWLTSPITPARSSTC